MPKITVLWNIPQSRRLGSFFCISKTIFFFHIRPYSPLPCSFIHSYIPSFSTTYLPVLLLIPVPSSITISLLILSLCSCKLSYIPSFSAASLPIFLFPHTFRGVSLFTLSERHHTQTHTHIHIQAHEVQQLPKGNYTVRVYAMPAAGHGWVRLTCIRKTGLSFQHPCGHVEVFPLLNRVTIGSLAWLLVSGCFWSSCFISSLGFELLSSFRVPIALGTSQLDTYALWVTVLQFFLALKCHVIPLLFDECLS